ncbi:DUF58 domain-containing protein [Wenzhouxiangella sp. AB-CW3]|uniref:DUF58 domain-containing protein n=1 Tax=Wenzhouxiangella sp. AB-CW3 TaxID=2771012 RepID=UPI00168B46B9|nr:DUF58 domain-containing protein [Wenzhouxiangella sp. AB-CW3]QOC21633.1 DUF58 domain-containing protein [Wenzhouxiangella sp. AB-CW3]
MPSLATSGLTSNLRRRWQATLDHWIRRRAPAHPPLELAYRQIFILPTRFGWMLGVLMGAMLIGSLNFNNNLGLLTTFIVAGLAVNSMLMAFRNLHRLGVRGGSAQPVFAGQEVRYRLTLFAADGRPRPSLLVGRADQPAGASVPGNSTEVSMPLPTRRRGWHQPGRIQIATTHPLGLFRAWAWIWPQQAYLVWPDPAPNPPPLPGSGAGTGDRQRFERSEGEDFYSLREWREGDPLHRIAWKASQRHRTLLSRQFRRATSPELVLTLDQAAASDLETRIRIVTAWILQADQEGRRWMLRLNHEEIGPDQGTMHRNSCLRALAEL